ncbi:glutamate racemase [Psychrobacter sp. 72-O-c]|uniref:glutamate racemase n=1 Tax=Psychrobacter sp. 72-O-c TaxID=2774125 RepID=UPI00191A5762|nr:glutamate racemase [Psychrobacter sp. 72-O-c]
MSLTANEISSDVKTQSAAFDAVAFNKAMVNKERNAPIGLFDSGVGGLSVYLHLAQQLPDEHYIYYADTLHVPYGSRDSKEIETLTLIAVEWLYQQGCKLIVIACNSASAYALETARRCYPQLPIVGLVPALKPAILASKSGHVAVLATKATLNGTLLNQVITNIALPNQTLVTKYFDPQLVPWVEAGMPENSETAQRLRQQVQGFAQEGIDQLVLGCTHYPFFKPFLLQEIESQQLSMDVVDSGKAIAERVKQLLVKNQLLALPTSSAHSSIDSSRTTVNNTNIRPPLIFYASKYDDKLGMLIQRLLGTQICLQRYC